MTEDEAKTKWCPFVRLTASQGEWHTNREGPKSHLSQEGHACCIASACMAWRWVREEVSGRDADGFGYIRVVSGGYCGLAGAPQ